MIAIWLVPSEEDKIFYQKIINELSKEYNTPLFEPHITLAAAKSTTSSQLNKLKSYYIASLPIKVNMKNLGSLGKYYQQVFISGDGGQRLLNMWQKSLEVLEMPAYQFMPHLSLLYGNLHKETVQVILDKYKDELDRTIVIESVKIMDTGGEVADWKAES